MFEHREIEMSDNITLPTIYSDLTWQERINVRKEYIKLQEGNCFYCKQLLNQSPPKHITSKFINWDLFPEQFLKHPIHLQHSHKTGFTEGAVHAYCNAVMWQYEGK